MPAPQAHSQPSKSIFNLPNFLTSLRLLAIPFVVWLLLLGDQPRFRLYAALLFGAAFITDYFDGFLARKMQKITAMGKIMDPMADKLMILAGLVMLGHLGYLHPIWIIVLLGREFLVNSLRSFASTQGHAMPSSMPAKIKVFAQAFGIAFLMLGPHASWLGIPWYTLGKYCIFMAIVLALWSASHYFYDFLRFMRQQELA